MADLFQFRSKDAHVSKVERDARDYCRSIGADPDQEVLGFLKRAPYRFARWRWYTRAMQYMGVDRSR